MKLDTLLRRAVLCVMSASVAACAGGGDGACTVEENNFGSATIVCPDGTSATVGGTTVLPGDHCSLTDNGDGTSLLACPDGTSITLNNPGQDSTPTDTPPVEPPTTEPNDSPITADDLSIEELERVDFLRTVIAAGLDLGQTSFLDNVDIILANNGILTYDSTGLTDDYSVSEETADACPFVQYYDNGFTTQTVGNCDYLLELAKIEMYSQLTDVIAATPAPTVPSTGEDTETSEESADEDAAFWYEQGAVSGIEQYKVMVRADMKVQSVCNTAPTVPESAYDKGLIVGAQILADQFNEWLAEQGETPDYPTMANPIELCNIDDSALDPSRTAALAQVAATALTQPLCDDYAAPTSELATKYEQATIDYEKGIRDGIEAEFSLAAVKIFRLIPCNVGDPIVVDLDGDGIELLPVYRGVNFDFYGTQRAQATAWVSKDDGLLVMDRNQNGRIDDGTELFGNVDRQFSDGFDHLAALDANKDGALDANDPEFQNLRIWKDTNSDAKTDAGELLTLAEVGLEAIPVQGDEVSMRSAGVRIPLVTESNGMLIGDALFTTAPYASPSLAR